MYEKTATDIIIFIKTHQKSLFTSSRFEHFDSPSPATLVGVVACVGQERVVFNTNDNRESVLTVPNVTNNLLATIKFEVTLPN